VRKYVPTRTSSVLSIIYACDLLTSKSGCFVSLLLKLDDSFLEEDRMCNEIGVFLIRLRNAPSDADRPLANEENLDILMSSVMTRFLSEYPNEEQYSH
jgi:hypothetical protein